MKVLLSIKPEYVKRIMTGEKKFEYRKQIFKKKVDKVVIYSTLPVGKIVGEFQISNVIKDNPNIIWQMTKNKSGISEEKFQEYFNGREYGYAIEIKRFIRYCDPINPKEIIEGFVAPQSFRYIENHVIE